MSPTDSSADRDPRRRDTGRRDTGRRDGRRRPGRDQPRDSGPRRDGRRGGDGREAAPSPKLPADARPEDLDRAVRAELRPLPRQIAETVARHLVAAGRLLDEDPASALAHAGAARERAARIPAVREATGLAAYHAGEWQTAIAELRTYHRMSGRQSHLAVLADCERALGRPARALEMHRRAPRQQLEPVEAVELLIVAAGAQGDLGQRDAAVTMLRVPELAQPGPWAPRLRYAYAEALLAVGDPGKAREWFSRAAEVDEEVVTDAADRMLELDGVVLDDGDTPGETADATAAETVGETADETAREPVGQEPPARLVDGYGLVVLDLDGVIYRGEEPVPGAVEVVTRLRRAGAALCFATNNASRTPDEVAALLERLGVAARADEVLTSAMVAADRLVDQCRPDSPVLVVGAAALADEVTRVGLHPVRSAGQRPAAVVQGYAPEVGWAELAEACVAVRGGAVWMATNTDATLPSGRGPLPGNGALVAAVATAVGRGPDLVAGKPEPGFFRAAARRTGAQRALVVGDRMDTDVDGATRAKLDSLLVLTGVTSREDLAAVPAAAHQPTYVADDLWGLLDPPVRASG